MAEKGIIEQRGDKMTCISSLHKAAVTPALVVFIKDEQWHLSGVSGILQNHVLAGYDANSAKAFFD